MHRGLRNAVILGDIRGQPLLAGIRQDQVGPIGQRRQRATPAPARAR
ncbi:hypothetical protein HMPREF0591_4324 [Mycobacterium parascrofulaceum ATCC BAA-614]|uniref:Uncharacterized protein n=1 Tax=Mycobacterium parascrofulaceum ATCC BAA-614 TaxID=525368 RepID=D5PDT0_9MYCO|nr:hypothetical protein HMPREF0591_4324 [Mycobacterium parascrofulaceum ATCC BAA-614]